MFRVIVAAPLRIVGVRRCHSKQPQLKFGTEKTHLKSKKRCVKYILVVVVGGACSSAAAAITVTNRWTSTTAGTH